MKLQTLDKLLQDQLKDLYSAESQILKALPKMVKNASSEQLQEALENHLEETRGQVERLNRIGEILNMKLTGKKCHGMEGLLEEGKEVLEADGEEAILDAAMIAAAQRVEHYEIAAYGTARTLAEQLGQGEIARLLEETLKEESAADEILTTVAENDLYPRIKGDRQEENGEAGDLAAEERGGEVGAREEVGASTQNT